MKQFIHLIRLIRTVHEQMAAQRAVVRGIYSTPRTLPAEYDRPAYLRRTRTVAFG